MQQVLVNIENKELEKRLLDEAEKKGRKLANIIIEVLEKNFLKKNKTKFRYKKLNPLKHMSEIEYDIRDGSDEELSDTVLFEDVKDSSSYIRELRKNAWRKK